MSFSFYKYCLRSLKVKLPCFKTIPEQKRYSRCIPSKTSLDLEVRRSIIYSIKNSVLTHFCFFLNSHWNAHSRESCEGSEYGRYLDHSETLPRNSSVHLQAFSIQRESSLLSTGAIAQIPFAQMFLRRLVSYLHSRLQKGKRYVRKPECWEVGTKLLFLSSFWV